MEGFVTLTPESSAQPTLSIPYMGFYGDWTQAPIIDATDYGDVLNGADSWSQAYTNTAASSSLEGTVNTYLGDPLPQRCPLSLSDRNAISPNDDDYMDSLSFVYTGLLRNVKSLTYEIKDAATGEVYYSMTWSTRPSPFTAAIIIRSFPPAWRTTASSAGTAPRRTIPRCPTTPRSLDRQRPAVL